MIYLLIYIAITLAIPLWDAYIGFGFEFPEIEEGPNAVLAGLFWPIGLPIILIITFSIQLEKAKQNRLRQQEKKERIRIAKENMRATQEAEIEAAMRQVEEEMKNEKSSVQTT